MPRPAKLGWKPYHRQASKLIRDDIKANFQLHKTSGGLPWKPLFATPPLTEGDAGSFEDEGKLVLVRSRKRGGAGLRGKQVRQANRYRKQKKWNVKPGTPALYRNGKQGAKTLMKSLTQYSHPLGVRVSPSERPELLIGTNIRSARLMQFGGSSRIYIPGGEGYKQVTVPSRPFAQLSGHLKAGLEKIYAKGTEANLQAVTDRLVQKQNRLNLSTKGRA